MIQCFLASWQKLTKGRTGLVYFDTLEREIAEVLQVTEEGTEMFRVIAMLWKRKGERGLLDSGGSGDDGSRVGFENDDI